MLRKIMVVAAVALFAATGSGLAVADDTSGGGPPVRTGDRTWLTEVSKRVTFSGSGYNGRGGNVGGSADFTPPACWYEPFFDSAGAKEYLDYVLRTGSIGNEFAQRVKKLLEETGKLPFHEGEEGVWYGPNCAFDTPAAVSTAFYLNNPDFVWVGPGYPPEPGPTVDARALAEIARAFLEVPIAPITSNPEAGKPSTVNLPTWLWSERSEVDVTAAIPGLASTVVARLEDIRVTSVPAGATTHPGGGDCGGLGKPFNGSEGAPPCGVTFGSPAAAVTVGIEAVWHLSWTSTNGQGDDMGTVPFAQTLGFAVHEVQVVNGQNWRRPL